MATLVHRELSAGAWRFYGPLLVLGGLVAAGFAAFLYMEINGHHVTGMDNQMVWGLPHVFAVFLIVAASGALNVASVASVFGKLEYKPLAPLSGMVSLCVLAGGLAILAADLGRPDRLIVAMTHFNFKSIFALNMFLYSGFFAIVGVYLWFMMERRMSRYSSMAGLAAFIWRIVLTTGTGSIFGFLVAREAYDSALLGPTFVIYSFSYGTALFLIVALAALRWDARALDGAQTARLGRLLAILTAASLYMTAVFHLTKLYVTRYHGIESFLLAEGGIYPLLFWVGQVGLGGVLPLAILYAPRSRGTRAGVLAAAVLVVLGGLAQMYVTIIGAQAWPQPIFPGWQESSRFFDGEIHAYAPSVPELFLALGGVALAAALVAVGVKVLPLLPESCTDSSSPPPTSPPARPR
ncbi:MAG: molybdopterin oxidoreductase [Betaproteobacteria bacterium RIFCSPLOWO2_02_67_12]|nr:MAG: molybdopterin oxidoreductase [Betaproteobacteria bacterium RIFCSPLOWO2_02_67_12]OGA69274.1 MAG: molybdopterin oxidoreductase [Betaproteobacteria bacterium RIFCSPLOWO2_12_FULL_67_28]